MFANVEYIWLLLHTLKKLMDTFMWIQLLVNIKDGFSGEILFMFFVLIDRPTNRRWVDMQFLLRI
jgi:hypothetical protein